MNKNFKKFREEKNISLVNVAKLLRIEEKSLKAYESERLIPKFELLTRLVQKTNLSVIITDSGDIEYFGDFKRNTPCERNAKKVNIFKEIQQQLSLSKEEFHKKAMISLDTLTLEQQDNIKINIVKFLAEILKIVIIITKDGVKIYSPNSYFDVTEIIDENKDIIKEFSKVVCSYKTVNDDSLVNGYNLKTKTNKPMVFYARTKEEFICKYLRIYDFLNGRELETHNEDRNDKFTSFYEMEYYYLNNVDEFFSKSYFDFTSYKWEGENLYTLWGSGLYAVNTLKTTIEEVEEYPHLDYFVEPTIEEIEELYNYIINDIL